MVLVGFGWTGAILGQELTDAGLSAGARARRLARHADRFRRHLRAGRAALLLAPRAVPGAGARDADVPQQRRARRRCRCASWARSCRHRRRRRRHPLERPDLAFPAVRLRRAQPQHRALRRDVDPDGHDDPGLGRHLRRARAVLRQVRISLRHQRQGRQPQRRRSRRAAIRSRARARATIPTRRWTWPTAPTLFAAGGEGDSGTIRSRARRPTCRAPTPTRSACSSARAPIAASAKNTAAATIPRRARRRRILPVLMRKDELRACAPTAKCSRSTCDSTGKRATGVTYVDAQGRGIRAAGGDRHPVRLSSCTTCSCCCSRASAQPYDPTTGQGVDRQELRLSDRLRRRCLLRRQDHQSVHRRGRARHGDRRLQRRQFRPRAASASSAAATSPAGTPTAARSRPTRRRRARRSGARSGRRRSPRTICTRPPSRPTAR